MIVNAELGIVECESCKGNLDDDESRSVADTLGRLVAGDIFHATSRTGASLLCIVNDVRADAIAARRFTTGEDVVFDRTTGALIKSGQISTAWIDTVEPLPTTAHNTFVEMDRRYRLGKTFARVRLTEAEIEAMLKLSEHVRNHAFRQVEIENGVSP